MSVSARLIRLGVKLKVPIVLENPATSMLWLMPPIARLVALNCCTSTNLDFCAFASPWRKRTRFSVWHGANVDILKGHICSSKKGMCDYSGKQHVRLEGCKDGVFLTYIAQAYPKGLCNLFARLLDNCIRSVCIDKKQRLFY